MHWLTASTGSAITVPILKPIRGGVSHAIGAILGAAVGAILMGIFTALSVQAALLVVFSPLIAAVLGWQIATNLYRAIRSSFASIHDTSAEDVLLTILGIVGAVLAFVAAYLILNVGRGLLDGRRPLTEEISILGLDMRLHVFYGIVFGGVLGAINWGLIGIQASMPLGLVVYNSVRTTLNILRSIEPLMMGIVFVIWVGAGPFAGVLALTLHSIAALGKLYSEQVENIDAGPIEAIQSTGANRLPNHCVCRRTTDCSTLYRIYALSVGHQRSYVHHYRLCRRWWYRLYSTTTDQSLALSRSRCCSVGNCFRCICVGLHQRICTRPNDLICSLYKKPKPPNSFIE